jgi:hypothetical protein
VSLLFGQVFPGNAQSRHCFTAAGDRMIGSELLLPRETFTKTP